MEPVLSPSRQQRLAQEVSRYVQVLAHDDTVCQVLLFGSLATEQVWEWSDVDLIVLQKTPLPFFQRVFALRERLDPQVGLDLWVYTPTEFAQLAACNRFIQAEVLAKGRVMNDVESWLRFAKEDLQAAEVLLQADIPTQAAFHLQQSVEKGLKVLLVHQGQIPPRTHSIQDLLGLLSATDLGDWSRSLGRLDAFYLATRYPDALGGLAPGMGLDQGMVRAEMAVVASALHQIETWVRQL